MTTERPRPDGSGPRPTTAEIRSAAIVFRSADQLRETHRLELADLLRRSAPGEGIRVDAETVLRNYRPSVHADAADEESLSVAYARCLHQRTPCSLVIDGHDDRTGSHELDPRFCGSFLEAARLLVRTLEELGSSFTVTGVAILSPPILVGGTVVERASDEGRTFGVVIRDDHAAGVSCRLVGPRGVEDDPGRDYLVPRWELIRWGRDAETALRDAIASSALSPEAARGTCDALGIARPDSPRPGETMDEYEARRSAERAAGSPPQPGETVTVLQPAPGDRRWRATLRATDEKTEVSLTVFAPNKGKGWDIAKRDAPPPPKGCRWVCLSILEELDAPAPPPAVVDGDHSFLDLDAGGAS